MLIGQILVVYLKKKMLSVNREEESHVIDHVSNHIISWDWYEKDK